MQCFRMANSSAKLSLVFHKECCREFIQVFVQNSQIGGTGHLIASLTVIAIYKRGRHYGT